MKEEKKLKYGGEKTKWKSEEILLKAEGKESSTEKRKEKRGEREERGTGSVMNERKKMK